MSKSNNHFLECLNYRINVARENIGELNHFYNKIERFQREFRIKENQIQKKYQKKNVKELTHQSSYKSFVDELKEIFAKRKAGIE